jgi:peptidoglycan/xylan/chitin deacetylase (PgdA/CDA1 family)
VEERGLSGPRSGLDLRLGGTPILMYHAVGGAPLPGREARYQVPRAAFERHLDVIGTSGGRVLSLAQVWRGEGETTRATAITFDDGRDTDYQVALPLLAERGFTADFFLNPGTIGRPGYLTWAQVREMAAAGMGVQSHAYDHVALWRLDAAGLRRQLGDSRRALEDAIGRPVEFLAAPFGLLGRAVVQAALEHGYRAVCTSWNWPARPRRSTLGRVAVYARTAPRELARLLAGQPLSYAGRALCAALVYPPKRLLNTLHPSRLGESVAAPTG